MERKQLQQWLNEIDKAIEDEKLYAGQNVLWPGSSTLGESTSVSSFQKTDRLFNSQEKTKKTIEQKRQEKLDEELDQMKNPQLSKKSQQLIFKSKREGKIEDRLMQEAQKRKQEASEREAKMKIEAKQKSMPLITPLAANLKREGDVVERLIDYQKVYQEKKDNLKKEIEPEANSAIPKINKTNVESRYMKPQSKNVAVEEYSHKPEISERSQKLAARLGDAKERLLQKPAPKTTGDAECTFTPSIIKKDDSENKIWWETLYQQSKIIQEKKEKTKEDFDRLKVDPECTFKPKLSSANNEKKENSDDRVKRLQEWQKTREDRLKQEREQNSNRGLEECTFAPKINKNVAPAQVPKQQAPVNKFLQRQYLNKQKSPVDMKSHEIEQDVDPEVYERMVKRLREDLISIPLD